MLEFLSKGGVLVGPILFCSVIALAIFLERLIRFARVSFKGSGLPEKVIRFIEEGKEDLALETAQHSDSPIGRVLAGALEVRGQDRKVVENVIAHTIDEAVRGLSRYLQTLATIGSITPMLGLLGTVTGMIKSFMVIQQMGGKVNAAVLAGGIWEAMLTTALGLAVALPAMVAHSYLDSRVDRFEVQIRTAVISLAKSMGGRL
ncbi:MAG: MotA/TolQ/ExbB proton channel family protein [Desulfobacteraceae bacterium]|nr:MAG: MotA/TolQ/ExbB proton channel family protein [Desulfobacteraceae bacterium]